MKTIVSAGVATVFGMAIVVAGGGPAAADPYNCSAYQLNRTQTAANCFGGTGTYRATAICTRVLYTRVITWRTYGPTVRIPIRSIASCGAFPASYPSWQVISLR
jgi:hypothetical protein